MSKFKCMDPPLPKTNKNKNKTLPIWGSWLGPGSNISVEFLLTVEEQNL